MNIYKRFGISDSFLDSIKNITEKKTLDPVDPKQAKGTFQARKDKDIDNDGKVTGTDKYLHARRNAISKAMGKKEGKEVIDTKPKIDDSEVSDRVNEQSLTPQHIKQGIGIARDKRYAKGNVTGAVKAMNKIHPALAQHPVIKKELQKQNENVELTQEDIDFINNLNNK